MIEFVSDLLTIELLMAFGICLLGGTMHGFTGWGGGIVMMPLMTLIYDPVEALAIIAVGGLVLTAQMYPSAIRTANWRGMRPLYLTLLIATPLGSLVLLHLDPSIVRRFIGVVIIAAALVLLSGWQYRGSRGPLSASLFGTLAGFVNGLTGTGGPPLVIYVLAFPESVKVQRANIIIGAGIMILLILVTLTLGGEVSWKILTLGVILGAAQVGGGGIGLYLFRIAPQEFFRRVTLAALIILGALTVFK